MFRPMRRKNQQLDHDECVQILTQAPRGVLSVAGDDGYPYGMPLNFVYDDDKIYFHGARAGHKHDAIAACDKVSFCVIDEGRQEEGDWWYHFRSVIAFGRIRLVEDEAERMDAMTKLGNKYFPTAQYTADEIAKDGKRTAILELRIEHLSGKRVKEK